MRGIFVAALAVAGSLLAVTSCEEENVHRTIIALTSPDGGTLSGFNCIEDEATTVRPCLEACFQRCSNRCRDEANAARDAGTPNAAILAQNLACAQACYGNAAGCVDECGPVSTSATGNPLTARANGKPVCVVIDLLRVGGEIECRSSVKLLEWCVSQPDQCAVLHRRIHCIDPLADVPADGGMEAATPTVDANYAKLRDEVRANLTEVVHSAPQELVYVRVLSTTQERDSLASDVRSLDLERVVGCSMSCPVLLSSRANVSLELDEGRVGYCRANAVRACAAMGTPALASALTRIGF